MSEPQFIRAKDVVALTTLSKPTIYRMVQNKQFPTPTRLSHRVSVWDVRDVRAWMERTLGK